MLKNSNTNKLSTQFKNIIIYSAHMITAESLHPDEEL